MLQEKNWLLCIQGIFQKILRMNIGYIIRFSCRPVSVLEVDHAIISIIPHYLYFD